MNIFVKSSSVTYHGVAGSDGAGTRYPSAASSSSSLKRLFVGALVLKYIMVIIDLKTPQYGTFAACFRERPQIPPPFLPP